MENNKMKQIITKKFIEYTHQWTVGITTNMLIILSRE